MRRYIGWSVGGAVAWFLYGVVQEAREMYGELVGR